MVAWGSCGGWRWSVSGDGISRVRTHADLEAERAALVLGLREPAISIDVIGGHEGEAELARAAIAVTVTPLCGVLPVAPDVEAMLVVHPDWDIERAMCEAANRAGSEGR